MPPANQPLLLAFRISSTGGAPTPPRETPTPPLPQAPSGGGEPPPRRRGAALGERSHRLTNQRGEHIRVGIAADIVAAAQQQPFAMDLNPPVDLDIGLEISDHPDLACGLDSANYVSIKLFDG